MRTALMTLAALTAAALALASGCGHRGADVADAGTGADLDADTDADADTDSDTDTDADADSDSDTGDDCDMPSGVTDWGQPCDIGSGSSDCAEDAHCVFFWDPPWNASETQGLCSPQCCHPDHPDTDYCTDIAPGVERCNLIGEEEQWCGIQCTGPADCPAGLACISTSAGMICYPPAEFDTDTDTGPDTDPCDGYTGDDPCCTNDDPCGWALNDICDCDSTCAWDAIDCEW